MSIKQTAYLRFSELPWQCATSNKFFKFYPSIVKTQSREKTRLRFHFAVGLKWKWNCLYIFSLRIYIIRNIVFDKNSRQRAEFTQFSRSQRFPLAICGWNKNARCFIFTFLGENENQHYDSSPPWRLVHDERPSHPLYGSTLIFSVSWKTAPQHLCREPTPRTHWPLYQSYYNVQEAKLPY